MQRPSLKRALLVFAAGFALVSASTISSYFVDHYTWWMLALFVASIPFLAVGGWMIHRCLIRFLTDER
jgi:hypothetical protein